MAEEVFRKIMDEAFEIDKNTRIWPAQLGEPLLLGDYFFRLVKYAKSKELPVTLNTNGTLIDKNLRNIISSMLDEVIIGIDAATRTSYEKIRVGGNFDRVVENINLLLRNKPESLKVTVQFVETEENEHEKSTFTDYWLAQGAHVKVRNKLGWGATVPSSLQRLNLERVPCPWLMRTVVVHWNGNVVQCGGDHEEQYLAGNVSNSTLYDLWNGPLKERRQRHLNNDFDFEPCRDCPDWACGISQWHHPDHPQRLQSSRGIA